MTNIRSRSEVHELLLSARPQPTDEKLARADELAAAERHTPIESDDGFRADTSLAIQKARQAILAKAGAVEGEKLLLGAIRADGAMGKGAHLIAE